MPRAINGKTKRARHRKILKLAKGYFGSKHALYRTAHEQVMRSLRYAFRDRKQKKREFRKLWVTRINAACRLNGISYSLFITGLKREKIDLNRKVLADIAVNDPDGFKELVSQAKKGLKKTLPTQFGQGQKTLPKYMVVSVLPEKKPATKKTATVKATADKKPTTTKTTTAVKKENVAKTTATKSATTKTATEKKPVASKATTAKKETVAKTTTAKTTTTKTTVAKKPVVKKEDK